MNGVGGLPTTGLSLAVLLLAEDDIRARDDNYQSTDNGDCYTDDSGFDMDAGAES